MMFHGHLTPERFRELRERAGVSQARAARLMGVTPQALCRYEKRAEPWASVAEWRLYRCSDWLVAKAKGAA